MKARHSIRQAVDRHWKLALVVVAVLGWWLWSNGKLSALGLNQTMCGAEDAKVTRKIPKAKWSEFKCMPRAEAKNWNRCLTKKQYAKKKDQKGCPGAQRCCPAP